MNPSNVSRPEPAFSRLELLVILAALALLAAIAWPALAAPRPRSQMVECLNNLRRVGQGFHVWATDHGDLFPWNVSTQEGGAQGEHFAYSFFLVVSNEFGTPQFLVCPGDNKTRASAFGWPDSFDNAYLSYFAGLHGNMNRPRSWLAGDRNISGLGGQYCSVAQVSGCTSISPTNASAWDITIHVRAGNLLLADGSTAPVSNRELTNCIERAVAQDCQGLIDILNP